MVLVVVEGVKCWWWYRGDVLVVVEGRLERARGGRGGGRAGCGGG